MAPRRKCKFNSNLQKEYVFIKKIKLEEDYEVQCTICGTTFSVAHGGRSDINDHVKSDKHQRSLNAASSS